MHSGLQKLWPPRCHLWSVGRLSESGRSPEAPCWGSFPFWSLPFFMFLLIPFEHSPIRVHHFSLFHWLSHDFLSHRVPSLPTFRGPPHDFLSHRVPDFSHSDDFLKSFSSTSHDTAHFLMTSSSLSPLQGITPLTFSIFPLDKYPYGVYIITRIVIPLQGINPNNPLTLRKESYLCPIIIVIKTRQIPIFPQTQCLAIPHPINHRSVPAAVWSTQTVQRLTARNLSTAWNVSRDRYGES